MAELLDNCASVPTFADVGQTANCAPPSDADATDDASMVLIGALSA